MPNDAIAWVARRPGVTGLRPVRTAAGLENAVVGRVGDRRRFVAIEDAGDVVAQVAAAVRAMAWAVQDQAGGVPLTVVVGRGPQQELVAQGLRTLRAACGDDAFELRLHDPYRDFPVDEAPAARFDEVSLLDSWAKSLHGWLVAQPRGLAANLAVALNDSQVRLYARHSQSGQSPVWSLTWQGLSLGEVSAECGWVDVGRLGGHDAHPRVKALWRRVCPDQTVRVDGFADVAGAVAVVEAFISAMGAGVGPDGLAVLPAHGLPRQALVSAVVNEDVFVRGYDAVSYRPAHPDPERVIDVDVPCMWSVGDPRVRSVDAVLRTASGVPVVAAATVPAVFGCPLATDLTRAVLMRGFMRSAVAYQWWWGESCDLGSTRAVVLRPAHIDSNADGGSRGGSGVRRGGAGGVSRGGDGLDCGSVLAVAPLLGVDVVSVPVRFADVRAARSGRAGLVGR